MSTHSVCQRTEMEEERVDYSDYWETTSPSGQMDEWTFSDPTFAAEEYLCATADADAALLMPYTYTYASPSSTTSLSSGVRLPRYLRRYTICSIASASHHRPTSPLANSFVPGDYFTHTQDDTSSCAHFTNTSHGSSDHYTYSYHPNGYYSRSRSRPSPPPNFNPGPKVHQYRHTTIPSPSASVFATVISATPLSDPGATSPTPFQTFDGRAPDVDADPSSHPITRTRSLSIRSNHTSSGSVYSSEASSTCSFYTASADDFELSMDDDAQVNMDGQPIVSQDVQEKRLSHLVTDLTNGQAALQEDSPWSFALTPPKPILNDCSDSSGFASTSGSGFGFISRGGISSSDTEPDLADAKGGSGQGIGKTETQDYAAEWPLEYLTSIKKELDEFERENVQQEKGRRFSWGRKSGQKTKKDTSMRESLSSEYNRERETDSDKVSTKSRKLKKKRQTSVPSEATAIPAGTDEPNEHRLQEGEEAEPRISNILGGHEDPGLAQGDLTDEVVLDDEKLLGTTNNADFEAAMKDGNWLDRGHLFEVEKDGQGDGALEGLEHAGGQVAGDKDAWLRTMLMERVLSRTPQEILQGLDVVHEVTEDEDEEDVTTQEGRRFPSLEVEKAGTGESEGRNPLSGEERYPGIKNKGKERVVAVGGSGDMPVEGSRSQAVPDPPEAEQEIYAKVNSWQDLTTMTERSSLPQQILKTKRETPTPRKKLSKKRRSRRALQSSSNSDSKPNNLNRSIPGARGKKTKTHTTASKRASISTLRPRRTPKTLLSSLRVHVFRSFSSVGLMLGIDATDETRLSQERRTPNTLVLGRHFSGKHIPRFPSRLDGVRSVDKKVATYE